MFFFILSLSIIIPLILNNKKIALIISLSLLFILWGLQYKIVNDWDSNINRWLAVNGNYFLSRDLEIVYSFILKVCNPLSFFGFLMFSAFVELKTIYHFTRRYVVPQFYWITIFILMMRINLGLLMINSNRQSWALIVTMYASLYILKNHKNTFQKLLHYLIAVLIIIAAINIHKGAALSFLLLIFPLCIFYLERLNKWTILTIFSIPYFAKYFIDLSTYTDAFAVFLQDSSLSEGFEQYTTELNSNAGFSVFEQSFNYFFIAAIALLFHHLNKFEKFFGLCFVFATIVQGYLTDTLLRIMQFFQIYTIFILPNIINYINYKFRISSIEKYIYTKNLIKRESAIYQPIIKTIYTALIFFCIFSLIKNIYWANFDTWQGWQNFRTIFQAPFWI